MRQITVFRLSVPFSNYFYLPIFIFNRYLAVSFIFQSFSTFIIFIFRCSKNLTNVKKFGLSFVEIDTSWLDNNVRNA